MGRRTVYNEIFSEEVWEKVNPENKALLDDFIAYKRSSDKSEQTILQYYQMIRLFFCWNYTNNNDKFFVDMRKREFVKFFGNCVEVYGWSPARTATVKSTLSSLSNYIENVLDDEFEDFRNIVTRIEIATKQPVREKTVLSQEEIDQCLHSLVEAGKYEIACYLALAVASGARKAELLRFKVDYFKDENIVYGCLYKTPEKIKTKGRSSKGKMLNKYTFVNMFKPYFDLWMEWRKKNHIDSEWLFIVQRSKRTGWEQATVSTANAWCDIITKYLGRTFYSHAARHRYVTMMKESKLPDSVVVELMGWVKGSNLISVYNDNDESEMLGEYFCEDGIRTDVKEGTINDIGSDSNTRRYGR